MKLRTLRYRRPAAFRRLEARGAGTGSDSGVALAETLIATFILVVGLVGTAQLLSLSIQQHQLARGTTDAARFAQDKFEELMKLDFATDPAIQVSPANALNANVANFFDFPARVAGDTTTGVYTRRWRVQAGPTATTRLVTVRIVPSQTDRRLAKPVELTTVVRQW